jgi:hypothetical protein
LARLRFGFPAQDRDMPKILDAAVKQLKAKGWGTSSAYAIGTSALQKSGSLKHGTNKPTKQGVIRGAKSQAWRQANPPKGK